MAEIIEHILDAQNNGTVNVYAVKYNQRKKAENVAVSLPGNMDLDFRSRFCENIVPYQNSREVVFNPTSNGLEDGTYEYISLVNIQERWDDIHTLLTRALDYHGDDNRRKVPLSNLYVCELEYNNHQYYLCSRQGQSSDRLLKGKTIFLKHQDELRIALPNEVFLISFYVGFIVDTVENKILIFDKKAFQDIFKYDDYQKEMVQSRIDIIDRWTFISSVNLIKDKIPQKNVYRNLAKIFVDAEYMEQISTTLPAQLKANLLTSSPENFTENDFEGDKLVVTTQNLDTVMKMLAKGFKFNFFTNNAEQL